MKAEAHAYDPSYTNKHLTSMQKIGPFGPFLKVRLGPDFGPKSPDFDILRKTGLFRTGLSPDSIPTFQ